MSGTLLPNGHAADVPSAKIQDYLLNDKHPGNGGKARFFNMYGFTMQNWMDLQRALVAHPQTHVVVKIKGNAYGSIYEI